MTSVNPSRARKCILAVVLLLVPGLAVLAPPTDATLGTCRAEVTTIQASPMFADPGDTVRISVRLQDTIPPNDPEGTNQVRVHFKAAYAGGTLVALDTTSPSQEVTAVFSKEFTVPADAPSGLGSILITLATGDAENPVNNCSLDETQPATERTWGFWVRQKPDLRVQDLTVDMVRHRDGDLIGENLTGQPHVTRLGDDDDDPDERFTRYPNVVGGNSCFEENANIVSRAHFTFKVENLGDADFRPTPTGGDLPLSFRVKDGNQLIGTQEVRANISIGAANAVEVKLTQLNYSLVNKPGLRNISIEVDLRREYKETDENNTYFTPSEGDERIYFRAPDLVPTLTDVKLNSAGKATGTFSMKNDGDHRAGTAPPNSNICHSRTGAAPFVRVFLDKVDLANEIANHSQSLDRAGNGTNQTDNFDFESPGKISAGQHKIIAFADYFNATLGLTGIIDELNETNNIVEAILILNDTRVPTLFNIIVPGSGRTGEHLNITGNVTDDANFTLDVNSITLDFTYPDDTNHTFAVVKSGSTQSGVLQNNPDDEGDVHFWFNSTYPLEGDYTVRIRANDTVHEVLSQLSTFSLLDYPKTMELVSIEVCRDNALGLDEGSCRGFNQSSHQPANLTFLADFNQVARIRYQVPNGATGLAEEFKNATRKTVEIKDRDGSVLGNFTPAAICFNNLTQQYLEGNACSGASQNCEGLNFTCWRNTFQVVVGHGRDLNSTVGSPSAPVCQALEQVRKTNLTLPAQYNVTFWVGDAACKFRGHTPDLRPKAVEFRFGLWDTVAATIKNPTLVGGSPVRATDPARFRGDFGDNITVMRTFVQVLKGAQQVMLEDLLPTGNVNITGDKNGTYEKSFPTGIYTPLDLAGEYRWRMGAQDANLTLSWNTPTNDSCAPDYGCSNPTTRSFSLQDIGPPTVDAEGAHFVSFDGSVEPERQDAFQIGDNLTIQASANDDTRITVTAIVQNNAGVQLFTRPMTRVAGTLYRTENITTGPGGNLTEGEYRFIVRVVDSAGNPRETALRVFRVAANLPPGFSARAPPDGGFGPPNGTVGVDVSDSQEGVLTSSVTARFGINTAEPTTTASNLVVAVRQEEGGKAQVVRASFQLPGTVRHGDTVVVSVEASDGGTPPEVGNTTWSFKVDGLAPRSTLTCTRSHPASCGSEGPQSVRGDTEFTLRAEDVDPEDKAKSGVASLRYAVDVAGTPGTLQVVQGDNTTFRLGTFVAQDGFYTLRFRAVDAAGNEEPERRLVFAVDTQGPSIQNVLVTPTPQGWNLTSTISDTASDVRSASVFFRAGATAFEELPLSKLPDTTFWFGNIPGARRGAQVCYYLQAIDFLDNVATNGTAASPVCFAGENHPPALTVLSPREGEAIAGSLTVRWQVSDIDGDPVTVSVAYRRSGDVQFTPIPASTEEQGQRTKIFDTAGLVAGTYAIRVEAADNQPFNNRTSVVVTVTLGGEGGTLLPSLDKTTVAPGEPVKVRVEIARLAVDVEARLLRGGEVVQTQAMEQNPPGSRFWEAEFRIAEPGVYEVEVRGEYEDGEPFVLRAANALTVTGGGLGALDLLLMGALAVAVVAMAALGLRRRGWL